MGTPSAFQAMNTDFFVDGVSEEATSSVIAMVKLAESMFSRFEPDSEISRINQMAGEWMDVSPMTYDLLSDAVVAFQATEGLFNPFMGRTMQELGYDRSFELLHQENFSPVTDVKRGKADKKEIQTIKSLTKSVLPLEINLQQHKVRLQAGVAIDVGGIAKGWTAQRAADGLMAQGVRSGLIDAGGDVVLWGKEPAQEVWGIGVADPLGTGEDIADLWFEGLTAIATSNIVKRSWQVPGRGAVHHIIDPRTGVSAVSDLLQITVLARDLSIAEQYSKCLIALGTTIGFPWVEERRPDLAFIGVDRDGTIHVSKNLDYYTKKREVKKHVKWIKPGQ